MPDGAPGKFGLNFREMERHRPVSARERDILERDDGAQQREACLQTARLYVNAGCFAEHRLILAEVLRKLRREEPARENDCRPGYEPNREQKPARSPEPFSQGGRMSGLSFAIGGFGAHCRIASGLREMPLETLARRRACKVCQIET